MTFNLKQIPSQKGRIAIVTGANVGLGYETALALAKKEMTVILACRNPKKAQAAQLKIKAEVPNATLDFIQLDLGDLATVRRFAQQFTERYDHLDLLINNAGVMIPPYTQTKDGFELQFGVNHLGHFLLTGLLMPTLLQTPHSRVVSLSSIAHKSGKIDFSDLNYQQKKYKASEAYSQSKLACLLFALELNRRLADNANTISVAAHPGVAPTNLIRYIPTWVLWLTKPLSWLMTHPADKGALPTLLAALGESVEGGDYYGPTGFNEMKGAPGKAKIEPQALDKEVAKRLWEVSEELTNHKFEIE